MSAEDHEELPVDGALSRQASPAPTSPSSRARSSSPLDLSRDEALHARHVDARSPKGHHGRLSFSISSLLESSGRAAALRHRLLEEGSESDRECEGGFPADLEPRGRHSDRDSERCERDSERSERERDGDDRERLSCGGSEAEVDDDEGEARPFQPFTYTHMPFMGAGGLLPPFNLMPPMSAAAAAVAAGLGSQGSLGHMTGPGSVIRVPAHRPSVGGAAPGSALGAMLPHMAGAPLPWLAGLTPLERTAAMAHHLSALAPITGNLAITIILKCECDASVCSSGVAAEWWATHAFPGSGHSQPHWCRRSPRPSCIFESVS